MQAHIDHRDIVRSLDLGHIQAHSPGLIHWHPGGAWVIGRLEQAIAGLHARHGYQQVRSPMLLARELWEKSGHWDKYAHGMFVARGGREGEYAVKPMSCPGHIHIYQDKRRSWRELPMRLFEFGHVHRSEPSGALSGWLRLRGFVQDDSHVFCRAEDLDGVVGDFMAMVGQAYGWFGLEVDQWRLALRPGQRIGGDGAWDQAEGLLRAACQRHGIGVSEAPGEGAFYGPKLEASIKDRMGRAWQCGVAQVDFQLPERFELAYQDGQGQMARPVMVHHAVLGSLERWLAIVMEHQGGLPDWLSPRQVAVLPVGGGQHEACEHMAAQLRAAGVRAAVVADGPMGGRIREVAEGGWSEFAVVGGREALAGAVCVGQGKQVMAFEAFLQACRERFIPDFASGLGAQAPVV